MGSAWLKKLTLGLLVVLLLIAASFSHFGGIIQSQARQATTADMQISITPKNNIAPNNTQKEAKPTWQKIFPKLKPYISSNNNQNIKETQSKISRTNKKRTPLTEKAPPPCTSRISIKLTYNDQVFKYIDTPLVPCNHLVALDFHNKKINGTYTEKMLLMNQCITSGASYKFAVLFSMPLLEKTVQTLVCAVFLEAKDSQISFNPHKEEMFDITKERAGYRVCEESLYRDIYFSLLSSPSVELKIRTTPIAPKTTQKDNKRLTHQRSRHSTNFSSSAYNRAHNIDLALKKINGHRLDAGATFSFNEVVGKRTRERGFKEGNIIVSGKYQKGVGGGVCQVSTTLYNAALLGGMDIKLVKNHSLECGYELPSFDAMVSSAQDLKFKNSGDSPVFIKAFSKNGRAVVELYGEKLPHSLSRKYEIVHRKDPPPINRLIDTDYKYHPMDAESGTQKVVNYPRGELKTIGYLIYNDLNGNFIKKQKIRQDVYKATEGLLAIAP